MNSIVVNFGNGLQARINIDPSFVDAVSGKGTAFKTLSTVTVSGYVEYLDPAIEAEIFEGEYIEDDWMISFTATGGES